MYVILNIKTPQRLSREQKKLLEALSETDLSDSDIKNFEKFVKKS